MPTEAALITALNDRPQASPVRLVGSRPVVEVIDWGTWAAFAQRHLLALAVMQDRRLYMLGATLESHRELQASLFNTFGRLRLYPIVLRYFARSGAEYARATELGRPLASSTPELLTAGAWNFFRDKPEFITRAVVYPIEIPWFTPPVPAGTAYDLLERSLRPGCPRPPTKAEAAKFARDRPYDQWTVWGEAFLALDTGRPTLATLRRIFTTLVTYDWRALAKLLEFSGAPYAERLDYATALCEVSPGQCDQVAGLLLAAHHPEAAANAYQHWVTVSRDEVNVANNLTWYVRYLEDAGRAAEADSLARRAAETGSYRGMETLAELLERRKRFDEAEALYKAMAERYANADAGLNGFHLRQALRNRDRAGEMQAWERLQPEFPQGVPTLAMHALPPEPVDGVAPSTFGSRAEAFGLKPRDVIVGIDGYRVRSFSQYTFVMRLRLEPAMQVTVWRDGRYQQLALRVPQRWFGIGMRDYRPPVSARRQ